MAPRVVITSQAEEEARECRGSSCEHRAQSHQADNVNAGFVRRVAAGCRRAGAIGYDTLMPSPVVPADQSSHRLAHTFKGGELSYMALAMEREQTTYRSLLILPWVVLADP